MRSLSLAFPPEEYEKRLAVVRTRMAEAGLDALVISSPENICYLSGYESAGYFAQQALLVDHDDEPVLIVRALEVPNAEASCVSDRIVGYRDHEGGSAVIARAVADLGAGVGRVGVELRSRFLTGSQLHDLRALLPGREFLSSFGVVEGARIVKSERELVCIRKAGGIVESGMLACRRTIRAGRTEREIAAIAYRETISAGSDWTGAPAFVSSGSRSARAHTTWSDRKLCPGDPVFLEINAAVSRYHAALMRPACVAPVPERFLAMMDASRAALEAVLETIRPGLAAAEVDHACRKTLGRLGWGDSFRLRTGYSMGIGFENFGEGDLFSLHERNSTPIEPGMVLHIVPYLAESGFAGGAFSETVIVGRGPECVSNVTREVAVG
jgi:Xaa-Pro dipeptidase